MRRTLGLFLMLCAACGSGEGGRKGQPDAGVEGGTIDAAVGGGEVPGKVTFPARPRRNLDVLVVVDNSASMREEQQNLARNFPRLVDVLRTLEGGLPSLHLGVVSTDVGAGSPGDSQCRGDGDAGKLLRPQACAAQFTDTTNFIRVDGDTTNLTRGANGLPEAFECMATLGTRGCGFEQPLESMRRALTPATNPGFVRQDAYLAVLILSDEDDCSARDTNLYSPTAPDLGPRTSFRCFEYGVTCDETGRGLGPRNRCRPAADSKYLYSPGEYAAFLRDLKGPGPADDFDIMVAGIVAPREPVVVGIEPIDAGVGPIDAGPPPSILLPSCETRGTGKAFPAVRTGGFLDQFPGRSTEVSICDEDLSDSMVLIGAMLRAALGNHCITGDLVDQNPATPTVEPSCTVADVAPGGQRTAIESCARTADAPPCWKASVDDRQCGYTRDHLRLDIVRTGEPPAGVTVDAQCQVR